VQVKRKNVEAQLSEGTKEWNCREKGQRARSTREKNKCWGARVVDKNSTYFAGYTI